MTLNQTSRRINNLLDTVEEPIKAVVPQVTRTIKTADTMFELLSNPAIISVPLGFIGCWLGTMLSTESKAVRSFDELYVRSETGLGAETGTGLTLTGRPAGARQAAAATSVIPHP